MYISELNLQGFKSFAHKTKVGFDSGITSIELGAYGIPETLLVNDNAKIIKKYIGPLTDKNVKEIEKITNQ